MLMVCGIKFVTESTRFGAFALHLKDSDAVDHLVDCFVIAAKEIAKGGKLFFFLLVDFVLAVKSLIKRRFWLENHMTAFYTSSSLVFRCIFCYYGRIRLLTLLLLLWRCLLEYFCE